MNILGISAYYHDSAACLVRDGQVVAAAQEERFTRKKHDQAFPTQAIRYCLEEAGLSAKDLDIVAFYEKPFLKFERLLETYLAYAPKGLASFIKAMPVWLKQKLWIKDLIAKELDFHGKILFPEHHEAHAASAFFPSPFQEAAILTMDGVGEWATSSYGVGKGGHFDITRRVQGHGSGALRRAEVQGPDPQASDRSESGRFVPARHELFQLLRGADDDQREVPQALRGCSEKTRDLADAA
jgi:carbamoyltransferase